MRKGGGRFSKITPPTRETMSTYVANAKGRTTVFSTEALGGNRPHDKACNEKRGAKNMTIAR
jgi:hypothetical protein